MKIDMEHKNFERELPDGYKLARYINAKSAKFGLVFNLIALAVWITVEMIALIPFLCSGALSPWHIIPFFFIGALGGMIPFVAYIVLHELMHGWAYKRKTGEKLKFGMSWSCAFCGVPHIYTYRSTALLAVLLPLVVFTAIFLPLTVACCALALAFENATVLLAIYAVLVFVLAMHLGGCAGDIYVALLFMMKYKDPKTLMRDTGPEQYFYVPDEYYVLSGGHNDQNNGVTSL